MACPPSSSHAPAWWLRTSTPSRSLTSGPSLATRLSPSRIGLTSRTSDRRRAATDFGWLSCGSSRIGVQPAPARPLGVDLLGQRLDLLPVGQVLGQAQPGRVDHGGEDHLAAQVRARVQQLVEGPEAPEHVLGQLDPVDPDDQPAVADGRRSAGSAPARTPGTRPPSRRSSMSVAAGDTKVTGVRPRRSRQQASKASAHRAEWKPHAPPPARPASSSDATASGRVASSRGRAPRRVQEGGGAHIRPPGRQHFRDEGQLVVVDQHGGPGRGRLGRGRRELLVDGPEPFPRRPPVAVEAGPAGQVPEAVQAKPQRLVGDHVVVGPVVGRRRS